MSDYLEHDDPAAYEGLSKLKQLPHEKYECSKCKGHGGWILRKDAYGPGRHFMASCDNCSGYGYVHEPQDHVHDWVEPKSVGRCLTRYTCKICNKTTVWDSSD